ncbi:MAG: HAD-IA family hydrolase [Candidatus Micrarchaeia archaeon]
MFKAVLFDLDNTLLDFWSFKQKAAKSAARAMIRKGLPEREGKLYRRIFEVYDEYGVEYQKTFYQVIHPYGLEVGQAERIQQAAIVAYLRSKFRALKPYPGVTSTLRKLKKKTQTGIVTDAPRNKAWMRLVLSRLDNLFETVVTTDDTRKKKPHRAPFESALRKLKVGAGEVLFVGDNNDRDMLGAKNLGMKVCLAKYGEKFKRNKKVKLDYEIKDFRELLEIME